MDEVKQDILNSVIVSCSPKTDGELAGENYFFSRDFKTKPRNEAGNALALVHRVHEPADLWDITFCTR